MLTVLDLSQEDTQFNRKASTRREKKGPCPGCGGNDRFSVKQDERGQWVFMCRNCYDSQEYLSDKGSKRGWGDEIDYLRHYRKMNYQQARAFVGDPGQEQRVHVQVARATNWQEIIATSVKESEYRLWSEDTTALDYVRGRGLTDETIRSAHLGYSTKGDIPRLIIPSYNDHRYVAVYRRDLRADVEHSERWKDVAGSTKDELYLADCLQRRRPTVLVEAPLCALTILQEVGNLVNAVATAGVDGARSIKSLAQLATMPIVFVAFDADQAGDSAWEEYWKKRLPNARRLRPFLKDINDMLTEGWDIRAWIEQALADQDTAPVHVASEGDTIHPASVGVPREYQDSTRTTPNAATLRVITPCVTDSTPELPATLPLVTPCVVGSVDQDLEKPRKTKNEIAPNAFTVEVIASADGEKLEKTRKNSNFFDQDAAQKRKTEENRGNFDLDTLAPLPAPDTLDAVPDLLDVCTVCGGLVENYSDDGRPFCAGHFPVPEEHKPMREEIAQRYREALPGWNVEVFTRGEWEQHKHEGERSTRMQMINQSIQRTPMQQWLVDHWIEHGRLPDYWTILEKKLVRKGYNKAFSATEQTLLNHVSTPRVYPRPFPDYGYKDGTFGVVGMFGCNPGEYWTMEEWEAMQRQEGIA